MAVGHLITNRMRLVKGFLLPLLLLSLMLMTEGWLVRSIVAKKTWTARRVEPYCRTRDNPILAPPLARRDGLALGVAMLRLQLLCRPLCRTKRSRIWQDTSRESLDCDRGNSAHGERRSEKEGLIRLLFSTSDSSDDAPITSSSSSTPPPLTSGDSQPAPASPQIEPSRERCSLYYRSGRFLFGLAGLALLLMPDRTLTTLLAAKWGGAAGFLVAAGLCHVLDDANCHGSRLGSNTYKRLGLGLMGFFVIGLFAVPGEAAFLTDAVPAIALSALMTLLRAFGCAVAYQGWKRGVLLSEGSSSWTPGVVAGELAKGTKETLRGLRVQSRKKALTYRNCFLLVSLGIFSSVMEGLFNIEFRDRFLRTWFEISLQWSAVGRLFLIASMIYTLKDAAERDRLSGTTFIRLNVMVGAWSALVGLGQSIYPLGFAAHRGVEMYAFSLPFFTKALKGAKEKDEKEKEGSRLSSG